MREAVALVALAAILAAAVARPRWAPEWLLAAGCAALLIAVGVSTGAEAGSAVRSLGPTVGFLAALLLLADGCRRAGLFEALGVLMAVGARGRGRRLLAMVFLAAALTTAVLSLDATVVLLTPIVFVTAARLRAAPRPHAYACAHLANSASLLLPVSNLTNLLAFQSSGLSFVRFGALMAVPWVAAIGVEWVVLSRWFAGELAGARAPVAVGEPVALPRFALAVVTATLLGFGLSSLVGVAPVWFAAAGALVLAAHQRAPVGEMARAVDPPFLIFVLGLGVVVHAASVHGLSSTVDSLIPSGDGLGALLAVATVSAGLANLVNNLPATLIVLPVAATGGPGSVLAMLIGVNVGPNLTYAGSLATLLWRRVLRAHGTTVNAVEFVRLGGLTVPLGLLAGTLGLWLSLQVG